ncbi:MAG: carboxypeptidase-like regulatory domain-containing protein, partial [Tannerella sp.]|nr:carboxypeptidase-like regulatory domain-containing protein [Tannerella sp.]
MNYYKLVLFTGHLLLFTTVISKAQSISGVITGCADKQPLAGVTVKIAGKSSGTTTNDEGAFVLNNIKEGVYRIEFSCVGMKSVRKEVRIAGKEQKTMNLCMEDTASELEEVVIEAKSPIQRVKESSFNVIAINAET